MSVKTNQQQDVLSTNHTHHTKIKSWICWTYLSFGWYSGAEFDRPDRENLSLLAPLRYVVRPAIFLVNGFWNECFFNMVLISINVSNFGIDLTTLLISSSLIWMRRQFDSSDGNASVPYFVNHLCSYLFNEFSKIKIKMHSQLESLYHISPELINHPHSSRI